VDPRLSRRLPEVRKEGIVTGLRPDGKTQVTFAYDDVGTPVRLDTVVISSQHDPERTQDELRELLSEHVVGHVLSDESLKPFVTDEDRKSTRLNSSHVSISY